MSKNYFPERKEQYDSYVASHELTDQQKNTLKWLMSSVPNKYWGDVYKLINPERPHNERHAGRKVRPVNPNISLIDIDAMIESGLTMDQIASGYGISKPALYREMAKLGRKPNRRQHSKK